MFYYDYEHGHSTPANFTEDNKRGDSGYKRKETVSDTKFSEAELNKVKNHIIDNIGQPLTVGELASVADISKFYFVRVFKRLTGTTPYQFILEQRVEFTKRLLEQRQVNLSSVSYKAGFSNQSHFTTVFKRLTGMTPKEYKDSMSKT